MHAPRRSLSIVLPAYNEADRLPATLRVLEEHLRRGDYDAEILVVDDGSRDDTRKRARAAWNGSAELRVLGYPTNRGPGFAVRSGILAARRDSILYTDADLSTPITELERLWTAYDRGADFVIGSRRIEGARIEIPQPSHRRFMGQTFKTLVSLLGLRGFRDTQCGFKLMRAAAARRVFRRVRSRGFTFNVEFLLLARRAGYRIDEVPVRWADAPGSRINVRRESVRSFGELLRLGIFR